MSDEEEYLTEGSPIYDSHIYEYSDGGKISWDFRIDVPKEVHDDLKSSATINEDGEMKNCELRLGLISKERYDADDIRDDMTEILEDMDEEGLLPELAELTPDERTFLDECKPKISYDPHWGEAGYWQTHLKINTFFPVSIEKEGLVEFVEEYTKRFVDQMEWE